MFLSDIFIFHIFGKHSSLWCIQTWNRGQYSCRQIKAFHISQVCSVLNVTLICRHWLVALYLHHCITNHFQSNFVGWGKWNADCFNGLCHTGSWINIEFLVGILSWICIKWWEIQHALDWIIHAKHSTFVIYSFSCSDECQPSKIWNTIRSTTVSPSQEVPLDVCYPVPALFQAVPPIQGHHGCLWPEHCIYGHFWHFLAIKWVKMAGTRKTCFGSRFRSTQMTT